MVLVSWLHTSARVCWLMGTYNLLPIHARPSLSESSSLRDWNHLSFDNRFQCLGCIPSYLFFWDFCCLVRTDVAIYFKGMMELTTSSLALLYLGIWDKALTRNFFSPGEVAEGEVEPVEILSPPDLFSHANVPTQQIGIITKKHVFL